jgi:predicted PurR-regulated permease PerM
MADNNIQRSSFFVLLFGVTLAFLWVIRGFLQPIFWAIALGIIVYPLHMLLVRRMNGRESVAAVATVTCLVIVVILPLIGLAAAVAQEAAALYQRLTSNGGVGFEGMYREVQERLPSAFALLERFGVDPARIESQLSAAAVAGSKLVASSAVSIGQGTLRGALFFFLMLYLLFFFLRDGTSLLDGLVRALPLGDVRERHLLKRFAEVSRATIKGTLVVGIVQGAIGGVAFAVLGVGAPVLWGTVMAFASILPAIGPALVWLPAAVFLFVNGRIVAGIVLVAIGVLIIGLVDNVLRPVLVGRDTRLPDYLILLATLGGIAAFGLAGIVIGPIIAAFFLSIWHMAQDEFAADDDAETADRSSPAAAVTGEALADGVPASSAASEPTVDES